MVGKLAALIDEGHLGKFSDTSLVLERLKAISGGSEQAVDRKGLAALPSVALKVRFTIAVNELPRLSDSSAAMRSRLLVLPYFNTYEGREDIGLLDRLLAEIPGITNWAGGIAVTKGLPGGSKTRLRAKRSCGISFTCRRRSKRSWTSAAKWETGKEVRRNDLQLAWHSWCDNNGHIPGSVADFGEKLRAAVPRIDDQQRRTRGSRDRWYAGLGLTSEALADIARARNGA